MKKVLHISTECYPAAKAGGMGDVVGALPIYLKDQDIKASVIIPKYKTNWIRSQIFETLQFGTFQMGDQTIKYGIQKLLKKKLPFHLYVVDIPGLFDRESIYLAEDGHGYKDEAERFIGFQRAVLSWLCHDSPTFDILHCHDHMTGLIPFFVKHCAAYSPLKKKPVCFTIHNGQYRGVFPWSQRKLLPGFDERFNGLLDWDGQINSLATAIKSAWRVNTVSPNYMQELMNQPDTLRQLYQSESKKCSGIINGIDNDLWDPSTDSYLETHLDGDNWKEFKSESKSKLCREFGLSSSKALIGYIGRMAPQKGADILTSATIDTKKQELEYNLFVLGSGDKDIEHSMKVLEDQYGDEVRVIIAYDEKLARRIYAASDFLAMPSRFEPCGLNQMYAMRYGSIPIVSHVGGLVDTVPDIKDDGNGIVFDVDDPNGCADAFYRAMNLYSDQKKFKKLRDKVTEEDFSWDKSAKKYKKLYKAVLKETK